MIDIDRPHSSSSHPELLALFKEHGAALYVLCCFAGFDGAMRERDRALLQSFAMHKGLNSQEAIAGFQAHLRSGWGRMYPHQAYWVAAKQVGAATGSSSYANEVLTVAQAMTERRRGQTELEQQQLRYLAKTWKL